LKAVNPLIPGPPAALTAPEKRLLVVLMIPAFAPALIPGGMQLPESDQ